MAGMSEKSVFRPPDTCVSAYPSSLLYNEKLRFIRISY